MMFLPFVGSSTQPIAMPHPDVRPVKSAPALEWALNLFVVPLIGLFRASVGFGFTRTFE